MDVVQVLHQLSLESRPADGADQSADTDLLLRAHTKRAVIP
jgi:hypothetical protein